MKFECDGKIYDSDAMLQPRIQDKYIIALFITPDYSCVFGAYMSHDAGVIVKRIEGDGLESVAQKTRIPELRKAVDTVKIGNS